MLSNNTEYYSGAIDATGCVSNGWNLIKPNYGMYLAVILVGVILFSCIPCISFLLYGPVMSGIYYVLLRDMRGEPVEFSMMFKGFEKLGPTLAVGVLQMLPWIIWQIIDTVFNVSTEVIKLQGIGNFYQSGEFLLGGIAIIYIIMALVFFVLGVIWGISFVFALPLVIERDLGPIEAIKLSARAAWSNVGGIVLLGILTWLIMIAGFLVLCIGLFLVLPVIYAAWAFAFRQVFPAVDGPVTKTGPPMPDEYGLSFGRGH